MRSNAGRRYGQSGGRGLRRRSVTSLAQSDWNWQNDANLIAKEKPEGGIVRLAGGGEGEGERQKLIKVKGRTSLSLSLPLSHLVLLAPQAESAQKCGGARARVRHNTVCSMQ